MVVPYFVSDRVQDIVFSILSKMLVYMMQQLDDPARNASWVFHINYTFMMVVIHSRL